jgi:hypothetical protein
MFQTGYDTMLFQIRLFHFGIISRHQFQISLETNQIIMGFPIELVQFNILLLQVLNFPNNLLYFIQFIRQVLVFMMDPIQLFFYCDQFLS